MALEVYDVSTMENTFDMSKKLHGRRQIFTDVGTVTDANVLDVLTKALSVHELNR